MLQTNIFRLDLRGLVGKRGFAFEKRNLHVRVQESLIFSVTISKPVLTM